MRAVRSRNAYGLDVGIRTVGVRSRRVGGGGACFDIAYLLACDNPRAVYGVRIYFAVRQGKYQKNLDKRYK